MSEMPERAERAFEGHDAFEREGEAFAVTTTTLGGQATAAETDDWALEYTLTVRAPMLGEAVTADEVGEAVEAGWFETYERRLEDAPKTTRADVELADLTVREQAGEAVAEFTVAYGNADRAPEVLKAMAEYAEGTYVEGIVPGYEYEGVAAELLGDARTGGGDGGSSSSMPL